MAQKFPLDEFDSITTHGGRHRVRRTPLTRLLEFGRIALVALVVAVLGYFGLKYVDSANLFTTTTSKSATVSTASKARTLQITILDATSTKGIADKVATSLVDAGFNVYSAGQLGGADSSKSEVAKTVVYYFDAANKASAGVIAKELGGYPVAQSTAYAGPITIVIGTDYK